MTDIWRVFNIDLLEWLCARLSIMDIVHMSECNKWWRQNAIAMVDQRMVSIHAWEYRNPYVSNDCMDRLYWAVHGWRLKNVRLHHDTPKGGTLFRSTMWCVVVSLSNCIEHLDILAYTWYAVDMVGRDALARSTALKTITIRSEFHEDNQNHLKIALATHDGLTILPNSIIRDVRDAGIIVRVIHWHTKVYGGYDPAGNVNRKYDV